MQRREVDPDGSSRTAGQVVLPRWKGDLRLLPSAVAAWAAAALAVQGEATAVTSAGLLAAGVGLSLTCLVFILPGSSCRIVQLVPALALALAPIGALTLVLLSAGGSLVKADAGPVGEAVRSGAPFTALLRISGEPSSLGPGAFGGGDRYLVDADIIGGVLQGNAFASATPVVVIAPAEWAGMGTGDVVRVLGTARAPDRPGEAAAVFFPASRPTIEEAEGWLGYTDDLRARFRDQAVRDHRDGGLLPGMALGDRIGLDRDLESAMKDTGLTHLTAVSGANCSYVVAFAFLGLRVLRTPRVAAAAGAVVALAGFVMLVRPEPSVLRAAVMGSIGVAAVLSGRGRVSLTLLMLSIIVLLAVDPWLSVSYAFGLSVAATLGLVTAGPMVADALGSVLPRGAAQVVAIPLTAQLFCTPILVLLQPALPVYSLPANVLVAPVVPAVTLLGMMAVMALVAAPALAPPLITAAQWGTRWVAGVAETLAHAPAATVPWIPGAPGAAVAGFASFALLFLLARRDAVAAYVSVRVTAAVPRSDGDAGRLHRPRRGAGIVTGKAGSRWRSLSSRDPGAGRLLPMQRRRRRVPLTEPARKPDFRRELDPSRARRLPEVLPRSPRRRPRRALLLALLLVACVAAVLLTGRIVTPPRGEWVMAMCDVGQGDGMVIRTTAGHAMVVDTGPDPEAMDRCLGELQIEVIDALVITHLHDDHYGGIGGAVRERQVSAIYYSSSKDGLPPDVAAAATTASVEAERLSNTTAIELPPISVRVLWPGPSAAPSEENNASAVLEVVVPTQGRSVTLLLTGDLEEDAADMLVASVPAVSDGGVDILKIPHHGARNGGSALIDAVHPTLALISVGKDNDYGHPHPAILEALVRSRIPTARTDELGSFTVEVVDNTMEVHELD